MRIFITGGTGYIGSHIVRRLSSQGDSCTLLARHPESRRELAALPGVVLVQGSMADLDVIRSALAGHDAVIDAALWWEDADSDLLMQGVRASAELYEAAGKEGIRHVVFLSSGAVHRPFVEGANEDSPLRPDSHYGAMKAATESFLFAQSSHHGFAATALRPVAVVGRPAIPGGSLVTDRTLEAVVADAAAGRDIILAEGSGRQFVSVQGLADLAAAVLARPGGRDAWLAADPEIHLWQKAAEAAVDMLSSSSRIVMRGRTKPPALDSTRAVRKFGVCLSAGQALLDHIALLVERAGR